ncbi:MAG TPA: HD domain-containing phosphohydrolase [Pseudothermotoga sp.]
MTKAFRIFAIFLFVIFILMIIAISISLSNTNPLLLNRECLIFLALGIIFEMIGFSVSKFSGHNIRVTSGLIVNILAASIFSPLEAAIIASTSVLIVGLFIVKGKDVFKYIFNVSQVGLNTIFISFVFSLLKSSQISRNVWVVLVISFTYMIINAFFFSIGFSLAVKTTFIHSFAQTMKTPLLNSITVLPLASVAYVLYYFMGLTAVPLVLVILLALQLGNLFRSEYQQSKFENLKLLVKSLELKDSYTSGHSERAAQLSYMIAKKLGLSEKLCNRIKTACLLHDVGKIGVPDYILNKPEKLSEEEFKTIKSHSTKSEELLRTVSSFKTKEAKWVRHHHERWDGFGYPDGLKGEEIPLPSRIIAAADIYEALTSARPYRKAYDKQEAINMIKEMSGSVLDPKIVQILVEIVVNGHFDA